MRHIEAERVYRQSLDSLRLLALSDFVNVWKGNPELVYATQVLELDEAWHAIASTYGEAAGYAAADYLFLQRSLNDSLAGLDYPDVSRPIELEQARQSFRWAVNTSLQHGGLVDRELAKRKLAGIMNRVVQDPARQTVLDATVKAGTRFARLPDPGACSFCLMLASRGAEYSSAKAAISGKWASEQSRYHDNCRCLAIEVPTPKDLPKINQDLEALWVKALKPTPGHEHLSDLQKFEVALGHRKKP